MKTKTLLSLFAFCAAAFFSGALYAFNGQFDVRVTDTARSGKPADITMYAKGEVVRTDFTIPKNSSGRKLGRIATIVDRCAHTTVTLLPDSRLYSTDHYQGVLADKAAVDLSETEFKPSGRKETIAGFEAEEYTGTAQSGVYTELWVTKELGKFLLNYPGMGERTATGGLIEQAAWSRFAYSQDFFVLRSITFDRKGGTEKHRFEVTKIKRGAQPDKLFKIPSGYKKSTLEEMGLK